jgi:dTDP-4-dehydrorhamnose 3,5-epimerase
LTDDAPDKRGWYEGPIGGVLRRNIPFNDDVRGSFGELWRSSWMTGLPDHDAVVQANLSRSRPRVLRGVHMHQRQADLWVVAEGRPFIALVDLRPAIHGNGQVHVATIDAVPGDALFLPAGVAHAFYARDPLTLIYFVTNEYDGTDEHGFAWNDPVAAIPWPDSSPVVSTRDAGAQSLTGLIALLRAESAHKTAR